MQKVFAGMVFGLMAFTAPQASADDATDRAIAHVRKLGGFVTHDEKRPGKPVVRVTLNYRTAVTDADLKELAPLTEVTWLGLSSTSVTPAGMKHLAPLKNLTTLEMDATKLTGTGLKDLAALPKLTTLRIYSCNHTEESLKELAKVTSLTTLVVSSALFDLNDAVLKEWTALKNLRSLRLYSPAITDEGLKSIATFTELTDLLIWFPRKTTPAGWKPLGMLTKLKSLSLAGGNDPKPEGGNITDTVVAHFAPLVALETLELTATGVTDGALVTIRKFGKLTALCIDHSRRVTDLGVKEIAGLKGLTSLKLNGSSITDESLEKLIAFKKLTILQIGDTLITRDGSKELREAFPNCDVVWYPRRK